MRMEGPYQRKTSLSSRELIPHQVRGGVVEVVSFVVLVMTLRQRAEIPGHFAEVENL